MITSSSLAFFGSSSCWDQARALSYKLGLPGLLFRQVAEIRGGEEPLHQHQASGFREWQRTQQDSIDDAEHGRVGPNAKREREHGHGGKAGVLQQPAEGEFHIVHGWLSVVSCPSPFASFRIP